MKVDVAVIVEPELTAISTLFGVVVLTIVMKKRCASLSKVTRGSDVLELFLTRLKKLLVVVSKAPSRAPALVIVLMRPFTHRRY